MSTERTPEQRGKGWSERYYSLNQKVSDASKRLYASASHLPKGVGEGVKVERKKGYGQDRITAEVMLTPQELQAAPEEVKLMLEDLGITPEDEVKMMVQMDEGIAFDWTLRPKVLSPDKVGITLSTRGQTRVVGLLNDQEVEATHASEFAEHFGHSAEGLVPLGGNERAINVIGLYGFDMNKPNRVYHPYMAEILSTGADWIGTILNTRVPQRK